jgi:hypothetical protein
MRRPEHGLAQQPGQEVAGVPTAAAFRQDAAGRLGQPQRIVELAVGEQPGVGGDAAAVELQLQAAAEIDPQRPVIRFTRRVFHGAATDDAASRWKSDQISLIRASRLPAKRGNRDETSPWRFRGRVRFAGRDESVGPRE